MAERWREPSAAGTSSTAPLREGDAPDWTEELLRLPDARRRLADRAPTGSSRTSRRRCARRSATRAGSTRTSAWEAAVKRFATRAATTHEPFLADFEPLAARDRRCRRALGARPARAAAHRRPACPTSTTATSCRTSRSSIPTTAGRSTGTRAAPRSRSRDAPHGESAKLHVIREALALRRRRPRGVRRARYEPLPRGRGHVRLSAAATTSSSPFRCAATSPRSSLPRGRWRNVLDGVEDALGGYRVLLLERR